MQHDDILAECQMIRRKLTMMEEDLDDWLATMQAAVGQTRRRRTMA